MTDLADLAAAPVPDLSTEWLDSHREALIRELARSASHRHRAFAMAGVAAAAATTATAVLTLGGGGTVSAFADWSPIPTASSGGQASTTTSDCQARLAQSIAQAQFAATNKGARVSGPFQPVLSDVRGPFTTTVLENSSDSLVLCLSTPDSISVRGAELPASPVAPDAIAVNQIGYGARDGQTFSRIVGAVGSSVSGVVLNLANGSQVTATVGHGLYLAWWPGGVGVTSATVTAADGTRTTQHLGISGPRVPAGSTKG